jgi:quinol monooxygenase YgiN
LVNRDLALCPITNKKISTLRFVAHFIGLPDKVEALKTILLEHLEPTSKEPGCIK